MTRYLRRVYGSKAVHVEVSDGAYNEGMGVKQTRSKKGLFLQAFCCTAFPMRSLRPRAKSYVLGTRAPPRGAGVDGTL